MVYLCFLCSDHIILEIFFKGRLNYCILSSQFLIIINKTIEIKVGFYDINVNIPPRYSS